MSHLNEGESRVAIFSFTVFITFQTFFLDQARALSANGWQVHILCSLPNDGQLEHLQEEGFVIHPVNLARGPAFLGDARAFFSYLRVMKLVRPEVFVGSTPKASVIGLFASLFCRISHRVYWVHGLRFESSTGLARQILRAVEWASISASTNVYTVSESVGEVLKREFPGLFLRRVISLGQHANGVDTNFFCPPSEVERKTLRVSQGFEDSLVVVGFLGRLHPDKGLATLALAMENLQVGEIAVKLVVKGYSDGLSVDFLEESLLRKVDAVVDVGIGNARDFYHSIDIFCMPSYREGLSTVNLEAAACGLPVVTTTATGCIDSLLRGESGLAVPPRDPEALASAISKLVTDPNLRVSMGQAGCNFVRANFERKIVWKRNLAFFDSLIG